MKANVAISRQSKSEDGQSPCAGLSSKQLQTHAKPWAWQSQRQNLQRKLRAGVAPIMMKVTSHVSGEW